MSDTPPYSEATVELVARAEYDADAAEVTRAAVVPWPEVLDRVRALYLNSARASLDALAAAGRLLPEGAEQRTEHGVRWSEDRIESWPEVSTYSSREQAEIYATAYPDLPGDVIERVVITTPWSAVPPESEES